MLPDEQPSPEQLTALRAMSPEQRWLAARNLYWTVRKHKTAYLRSIHPDWPEEELEEAVRKIFLYARS